MRASGCAGGGALTRGAFLKGAAAAAAVSLVPGGSAVAAARPMATRTIPKSGEALPVVGLGTARVFDVEGTPQELAPRREVLRALLEGGGKVIDTSQSYGNAERVVGRLLAAMDTRDKAFIADKISTWGGRQAGVQQMRTALELLRTDRVELMQVHNLKGTEEHLATIRQWRDAGKVRYVGVTHYRVDAHDALERVLRRETLDFVQLNYSLNVRAAEDRLLPLAAERGIAVLVNRPYDRGQLFRAVRGRPLPPWAAEFEAASWGQFFLKFLLSHPAVTCVIPGTAKPRHMRDNLGAGRGPLPDARQRRRMVAFWSSL